MGAEKRDRAWDMGVLVARLEEVIKEGTTSIELQILFWVSFRHNNLEDMTRL